jgi:hypothetical protein
MAISTGAAILGSAGAGLLGGVLGGRSSSKASKRAANAETYAADRAADTQLEMYHQSREDNALARHYGDQALESLSKQSLYGSRPQYQNDFWSRQVQPELGVAGRKLNNMTPLSQRLPSSVSPTQLPGAMATPSAVQNAALPNGQLNANLPTGLNIGDITASPMYQFQQQQGEEAINRALAARGMSNSSAAVNQLADFNTELNAMETEKAYDRAVDEYNRQYNQGMDQYGVSADNYGRGYQNALAQYGMDADRYSRERQANLDTYGQEYSAAMDQYNMANTQWGQQQQNALQGYNAQYGAAQDYYNRVNSAGMDQYNMERQAHLDAYGQDLDLAKIGTGASAAAGNAALATGQGLATTYRNQGNALANIYNQQGANQQAFYSGMGAVPMNAYATYLYGQSLK